MPHLCLEVTPLHCIVTCGCFGSVCCLVLTYVTVTLAHFVVLYERVGNIALLKFKSATLMLSWCCMNGVRNVGICGIQFIALLTLWYFF